MELFCFDIDGTLRDNVHHEVSDSTIKALEELKKNGHKIVVSTGRAYDSLLSTQIMDIIDWDGYVLNNGQLLLDGKGNVIEKHIFDKQAVLDIIRIADELGYAVTLKKDERIITKEPDEYVYKTQKYFNNPIPPVGRYNGKDDVYALVVYGPEGYDYAPFKKVKKAYVAPGMTCYADVTIADVSKATGNMYFSKLYNCNGYIAFGDSQNDLEMFKHAKFSICMGQGDPITKKHADYITTSIDEDGIYHACQHFKWIGE